MWYEGGPIKMSKIATERIKREEGLKWQPSEDDEQAAVMEWAAAHSRTCAIVIAPARSAVV